MKKRGSTVILLVVLLAGLSLLLYPKVSDWWNSMHQSRAIMDYTEAVSSLDQEEYDRIMANARAYNDRWVREGSPGALTAEREADYNSQLNPSGIGIMGTVDIPSINCHLPIYHGTEEAVLQVAVGHIDWSALPIGGEGTHSILSGHRGLPSARLFTDIDKLVVGDLFRINVLGETLTYEVDQINIVLPEDTQLLMPVTGEDLCTLVTCTPYGINTHRLLVRGHRVANEVVDDPGRVTADGVQIAPVMVAPIVGVPLLAIMMAVQLIGDRRRRGEDWDDDL